MNAFESIDHVADWTKRERDRLGWSQGMLAERATAAMETAGLKRVLKQQSIDQLEKRTHKGVPDWFTFVRQAIDQEKTSDRAAATPPVYEPRTPKVEIQDIDLAYGLGATFNESAINVDLLEFPRRWVESITSSPTNLLTWARGRGDSMEPTIRDGDMVLLDRSQTKVKEQDAIWAFMVGDLAQIKRLRRKGNRMVILSDNATVPDDEEPIDTVHVVARVVFIGHRS